MGCSSSKSETEQIAEVSSTSLEDESFSRKASASVVSGSFKQPLDARFPILTAMLVMPFKQFKKQGRITKSTADWRKSALKKGWLVTYTPDLVCFFISHRWRVYALEPWTPETLQCF